MSAPKSPGRRDAEDGVHVGAVEIDQAAVRRAPARRSSAICRSNMPSVLGLVIMNTAVCSSSLARRSSRSTQPVGRALDRDGVEAGHGGAGRIGAVALSGMSTLRALLAAIAEIGGRHQQRRQLALRSGRRLQRNRVAGRRSRPGSAASRRAVRSMPCSVSSG